MLPSEDAKVCSDGAVIAQFERSLMIERQRDGIEKAKREGKYLGRKPTARAKTADIIDLAKSGMAREAIAKKLGVSVSSVYSILKVNGVRRPLTINGEPLLFAVRAIHRVPEKRRRGARSRLDSAICPTALVF